MKDISIDHIRSSLAVENSLRRLFLQPINEKNLKEILSLSQDFSKDLKMHQFIISLKKCLEYELVDEARYEFNRLFVGPHRPKVLPYESTYFDYKNMFGKQTIEVRQFYENIGLKIEEEQFDKFPDDFIGFEIQYLYYMSFLAIDRFNNNQAEDFYMILEQKNEFIKLHPMQWFYKFASVCMKEAKLEIYKRVSDFLLVYLKNETEILTNILVKKPSTFEVKN